MNWLYGKTILITGASSGIGKAMTLQLIRNHQCHVIGIGQSEEKMKNVIGELSYLSDSFQYRLFDVSDENAWTAFARELQSANVQIDLLIQNAGMLPPFDKSTNYREAQIQRCMDVNFHASRYGIRALLPLLRQSNTPGIVNISSSDALAPLVGTSIYSASKAALKAYTEVLIGELGREMYIGYVCPGFVQTDIFRNQHYASSSKLLKLFSTDADKTAHKIIRKIGKQKSRIIVGKDAKFMNFTSKFFPVIGLKFYEIIIKKSKIELFENIR